MKTSATSNAAETDHIQDSLTSYAGELSYDRLPAEVIHAAKAQVIDTLGVLIGGFFSESSQVVRNLAAQTQNSRGSTIIGSRIKTTADIAAFVNATTARQLDLMDTYHWPGSYQGHPSDLVTPVLAVAECEQATGRQFITAIVLGYEVFCRMCDVFKNRNFDNTNFCCVSTGIAAGTLMNLSRDQLAHCISMAVVPNNMLRQVRLGRMSMWKSVASGQAGRSGVFAAMIARAGIEGAHLPFEGKAGWCDQVAGGRFSLDVWGGNGTTFKILDVRIKNRPANGNIIASILAAEKIAPVDPESVKQVTVEVYKHAREGGASDERHWNPDSHETANRSLPYNVAAALIDGTITPRSFDDVHLNNPRLRALLKKIEVVENESFTRAFERLPIEHRARVTVLTHQGKALVGEAGGDEDDLSAPKSDAQYEEKFRHLTEDYLGSVRADAILKRLWRLEESEDMAELLAAFAIA